MSHLWQIVPWTLCASGAIAFAWSVRKGRRAGERARREVAAMRRDIGRERQLARETEREGRLDSLGAMAGGIAHDFSNLIGVMMGQVELALLEPVLPNGLKQNLEELEGAILRARDFTNRLKLFAKGGDQRRRPVSLDPVLREASEFAVRGSPIRPDCALSPNLRPAMADDVQLLFVFKNLAVNAVQAMPKGGVLTIRAADLADAEVEAANLGEGEWLKVTVADTGGGIPPEIMARMFEPFFTKKRSGTGLGLPTCYSIVKKHGGHLRVETKPGTGTTFSVFLPAVPAACPELTPA